MCNHGQATLEERNCGYITLFCECQGILAEMREFCKCYWTEHHYLEEFMYPFTNIPKEEAWAIYTRLGGKRTLQERVDRQAHRKQEYLALLQTKVNEWETHLKGMPESSGLWRYLEGAKENLAREQARVWA